MERSELHPTDMAVPGVVVLGLVLVPLAAVGILMALVGAILASPYLLARSLRRRSRRPLLTG